MDALIRNIHVGWRVTVQVANEATMMMSVRVLVAILSSVRKGRSSISTILILDGVLGSHGSMVIILLCSDVLNPRRDRRQRTWKESLTLAIDETAP